MKAVSVLLLSLMCFAETYKILVVYPLNVKSLAILGDGIVRHLLNDGHQVTYITMFPQNKPESKNFRQIDISVLNDVIHGDDMSIKRVLDKNAVPLDYKFMQVSSAELADTIFQNENVSRLIHDPNEHFDAVIADLMESQLYGGLAVLYNCPMIWMRSMGAHWQVIRLIGDPGNPAYDPDYLNGANIPPLNFLQRVEELWTRIASSVYRTFITLPLERQIYQKHFGPLIAKRGRQLPSYDDVVFNASLILGNEHNAILSRPSTPQNFKFVGGFHVEEPVKPLPKNLQELMDNAPHGVIYFSMGTYWKSKEMPVILVRELLNVFGELKETVIWKYEDDLKDVPKNVHLVEWAPQPSILAHPNIKFFITHGGLLSAIESMHFGVPTIGIPILFDQILNVNKAAAAGHAIKLDLDYDLPKNLKKAINTMLTDDRYRKRVKELSEIYHDVPVKPGKELAHWVRHVIRTRGALHLRSPALNVPLYQLMYLDLAALIIVLVLVLFFVISKIFKNNNVKVKKN